MPLFEFRCTRCSHVFEELVQGDQRVSCPDCGAPAPEKLLSAFAVGGGQPDTACGMAPCETPMCNPGGAGGCGLN